MELLYAYVEKFRNYKNVELPFSNKFNIHYNKENSTIDIKYNTDYINIYQDNIVNINAVVGKNSVGKTNLFDLLGMRINTRNNNNDEYKIEYERESINIFKSNKIISTTKNAKYFFIYYYGEDHQGDDLFILEGNDIESFKQLIIDIEKIDINYYKGKYWAPFICKQIKNKLKFVVELNTRTGKYYNKNDRIYGDYRTEQDKLTIISYRDYYNKLFYDYNSFRPEDESKICIPRRIAKYKSKLLESTLRVLYENIKSKSNKMFMQKEYILKFKYSDSYLYNENKLIITSQTKLKGIEKYKANILESYVTYCYSQQTQNKNTIDLNHMIKELLLSDFSFYGFILYYEEVLKLVLEEPSFNNNSEDIEYILNSYHKLVNQIINNKSLNCEYDYFYITIKENSNMEEINSFVNEIYDEDYRSSMLNGYFGPFAGFFDYSIEHLSDGEQAFLGFYSSIYEQLSNEFTSRKDSYIFLLDEPEARMHPELARNFINDLIKFLSNYKDKKFQIIISTHSPFILSDIPKNNIVFLQNDKDNYCHCNNKDIKIKTFGANIHELLKDGFFINSTLGEYAKTKINEVITFLRTSNDELEKLKLLGQPYPNISKIEVKYIINSIGEPIIKYKLEQMYFAKHPEEKISEYTNQLDNLKSKIINGQITDDKQISELKQKIIETLTDLDNLSNIGGG